MKPFRFETDIESYRLMLSRMRKDMDRQSNPNPDPVRNDSFEHAIALSENLIMHTQDTLDIKTTTFCPDLYLNSKVFIEENLSKLIIRVLIHDIEENGERMIEAMETCKKYREAGANIDMRYLPRTNNEKIDGDFLLSDETAFRYERQSSYGSSIDANRPCKEHDVKAIGDLYSPDDGRMLKDIFDNLFKSAKILSECSNAS